MRELYIDGERITFQEDPDIRVQLGSEKGEPYICEECGETLYEQAKGTFEGCECEVPKPQYIPLQWFNSASIATDESNDSLTVSISTGDPRGAFTFTVRRMPEGSSDPGRLMLYVPTPNDSGLHEPLTEIRPGTYEIN